MLSHKRKPLSLFFFYIFIFYTFNSPFPPAAALQLVPQMRSLKSLVISFPQSIQNSFPALPPSICLSLSRCSSHPAQLLPFPSVYAHLFVCSLLLLTIISSSISSQLFSIRIIRNRRICQRSPTIMICSEAEIADCWCIKQVVFAC